MRCSRRQDRTSRSLLIAHNDIFGGTNGIHFASTISGDRHDTRIVYNTHINGAAGDGIQIEGLITDADVRIENNNHGIYGGANGVHLLAGLDGTAFLRIHGNVIRAEDADGVLIDGVGVSDYAELEITENRIGMTSGGGVERVGDEGVDIETITDHGSVLIGWNRIFAEGTGIQVDGPVTTVSQNLSFGYSPGQFGIAIIENHNIDALYGHGIQFADEVNGPPGQTVNILIAENNDGIHAGQHGITFDDYVDNANIHIHGNIIDAGLDDHVSDGVHFGGIVEDSWIKIDDHDDGPRHLNAYGDGIDFDALVVDSTIIIDDNDINAGGEPGSAASSSAQALTTALLRSPATTSIRVTTACCSTASALPATRGCGSATTISAASAIRWARPLTRMVRASTSSRWSTARR